MMKKFILKSKVMLVIGILVASFAGGAVAHGQESTSIKDKELKAKQIKSLNAQLASKTAKIKALQKSNQELRAKVADLDKKLRAQVAELEKKLEALSTAKTQSAHLEEKLNSSKAKVVKLQAQNLRLKGKITDQEHREPERPKETKGRKDPSEVKRDMDPLVAWYNFTYSKLPQQIRASSGSFIEVKERKGTISLRAPRAGEECKRISHLCTVFQVIGPGEILAKTITYTMTGQIGNFYLVPSGHFVFHLKGIDTRRLTDGMRVIDAFPEEDLEPLGNTLALAVAYVGTYHYKTVKGAIKTVQSYVPIKPIAKGALEALTETGD